MTEALLIKNGSDILEIRFNRPERKNAISRDMFEKMLHELEKNILDNNLKAIFLEGTGDCFCAGGDVKDMAASEDYRTLPEKTENLKRLMQISNILYNATVPTVAVINGIAAGAGFALSLACDFRISTELGKFTTAFSKVGFSGDFGITYFLSKIVGISKAKELLFFSDIIDANEAHKLGIVNYLIDAKNKEDFVKQMKNKIKSQAPIAIKFMKKNFRNLELGILEKSLEYEALYQMICSETQDHKNAVEAFVKKEKVVFRGK